MENNKIQALDNDALEYLKSEKEKGKTYEEIANDLSELGYTHTTGSKLTNVRVSVFACENGFRIVKEHGKRNRNNNFKKLDKEAFEFARSLRIKGLTTTQVAQKLNESGFTGNAGGLIYSTDVTKLLNRFGMRTKSEPIKKSNKIFTKKETISEKYNSAFVNSNKNKSEMFVEDFVMTSNLLTIKQKVSIASLLLRD